MPAHGAEGPESAVTTSLPYALSAVAPPEDSALLAEIAATLAALAARVSASSPDLSLRQALVQVEQSLADIRTALLQAAVATARLSPPLQGRLTDADMLRALALLLGQRPAVVTIRPQEPRAAAVHVVLCVLQTAEPSASFSHPRPQDLFVAVGGAGHGIVPMIDGVPVERVKNSLGLARETAVAVAELIATLVRMQALLGR